MAIYSMLTLASMEFVKLKALVDSGCLCLVTTSLSLARRLRLPHIPSPPVTLVKSVS
jgi:hypothetical protein